MSSLVDPTVLVAVISTFGAGTTVSYLVKRHFERKDLAEARKQTSYQEKQDLYQHLVKNLEPINSSTRGTVTPKTLGDVVNNLCGWQHDEFLLSKYYRNPKVEYDALKHKLEDIIEEQKEKGETGPIPNDVFDKILKKKEHLISKLRSDLGL